MDAHGLAALAREHLPRVPVANSTSVAEAVRVAGLVSMDSKSVLVVCGSFFIMRDARVALGIIEEGDDWNMNENFAAFKTI